MEEGWTTKFRTWALHSKIIIQSYIFSWYTSVYLVVVEITMNIISLFWILDIDMDSYQIHNIHMGCPREKE